MRDVVGHLTWRGAEVRHFLTLAAVGETGSLRAAAQRRGYVPSAVSQQIAELERIVGVRLVERTRGAPRVELTAAGSLLAGHGRRLRAAVEAVRSDLDALDSGAPAVSMAVSSAMAGAMLVPFVRRLGARAATLSIVETADEDEPAALVERGDADLGIGSLPGPSSELDAAVLREDPYVLVVPGGSALGEHRALRAADLREHRLLVPAGSRTPALLEAQLCALGLGAAGMARAPAWELAALVAGGAGLAVGTASMRWPDERGVRRVDARALLGSQAIGLLWQPDRAQRLSALATLARGTA